MNLRDLAIIIPLKDDELAWKDLLLDFSKYTEFSEIIFVVPCDINDLLVEIKALNLQEKIKVVFSKPGRAFQLNEGARNTNMPYFWFLHADSRLSDNVVEKIRSFQPQKFSLYFFNLKFEKGSTLTKLNDIGVWFRSNILKLPFGDQGFLLASELFSYLGRFPVDVPYGEDHILAWRAKLKNIPLICLKAPLLTSARKYQQNGWLKTTFIHLYLTYKQAWPYIFNHLLAKLFKQNKSAIAIFVKTPSYSPVKTRLAETIGNKLSTKFYLESINVTKDKIKQIQKKISPFFAVAEKQALNHPLWSDFSVILQGNGSLGERLNFVYESLLEKHQSVIFIGADSPHINLQAILQAQKILKIHPNAFVFGNCSDGGFYLFGGNISIPKNVWTRVQYSSSITSFQLQQKLKTLGDVFEIESSFDIDTFEDLQNLNLFLKNSNSTIEKDLKSLASDIVNNFSKEKAIEINS